MDALVELVAVRIAVPGDREGDHLDAKARLCISGKVGGAVGDDGDSWHGQSYSTEMMNG
jgi:hypothetical protein